MNCEPCCPHVEARIVFPVFEESPGLDLAAYQEKFRCETAWHIHQLREAISKKVGVEIVTESLGLGSAVIRASSEADLLAVAREIGGTLTALSHC